MIYLFTTRNKIVIPLHPNSTLPIINIATMNAKDTELLRIVDLVINCCASNVAGETPISREEVLGKARNENIVMTRTILVALIIEAGYSTTTAALLLHRDVHTIRHLINLNDHLRKSSKAYRIAFEEAERKYKECA